MDHEFCYDETGELVVRLDMGQEVTALWLNTDIIPKRDMTFALLDLLNDLEAGVFNEKFWLHQHLKSCSVRGVNVDPPYRRQ